jgi:hypothetical protein
MKQTTLAPAKNAEASVVAGGGRGSNFQESFCLRTTWLNPGIRKKSHKDDIEQLLQKRYTFC